MIYFTHAALACLVMISHAPRKVGMTPGSSSHDPRKVGLTPGSSCLILLLDQATQTLVCSLVLSRLDYCNSLLSGCPQYLLDKLQKVQNAAARLVRKAKKSDHIHPILETLH